MTNTPSGFTEPSGAVCGLKKPSASHQSYQAASTACGLYPAAIGWDMSIQCERVRQSKNKAEWVTFFLALGRRVHEWRLLRLLFFLCLGLFLGCWRGRSLLELLRGELGLLLQPLRLLLGWHTVSRPWCAKRTGDSPELFDGAPSARGPLASPWMSPDDIFAIKGLRVASDRGGEMRWKLRYRCLSIRFRVTINQDGLGHVM